MVFAIIKNQDDTIFTETPIIGVSDVVEAPAAVYLMLKINQYSPSEWANQIIDLLPQRLVIMGVNQDATIL
jgi:hypothetical protein